jgi:lactate permease
LFKQDFSPVSDSLGTSSIFAALPILTLFVLLGGFKVKAHIAALASLAVALLVAIIVYDMPVGQAALSTSEGVAFGLFPIMWIVVMAIWIYNMTVETGHFTVLRRSFGTISDDQRIQAVVIAFAFGALLEALAGFGTPVAITSVMLIALGFRPIKAASVALVANTAPVAFGAIAIPITTLSETTGLDFNDLGSMVGRQTPFLALIVPLVLVFMVDGSRGIRQTWPVALIGGVSFAIGQFVTSNYISVELSDIVASLLSTGSMVAFLRVWQPGEPLLAEPGGPRPAVAGAESHNPALEEHVNRQDDNVKDSRADIWKAYAPYLIIIAVFGIAQIAVIKDALAKEPFTHMFEWPGLDVVNPDGEALKSITWTFNWAPAAGTLLLVSGIITMFVIGLKPGRAVAVLGASVNQLKYAILTVATVLGLAYLMNQSGQTITLGQWIAGAGGIFLSSLIGWLGVSVTGSDTSSNALFGALQVEAAKNAGISDVLAASANSSGGVLGKMISPQNLAIGAAAVGMVGDEGVLFRKVLGWSIALVLIMCVLVTLQNSPLLDWMVIGN